MCAAPANDVANVHCMHPPAAKTASGVLHPSVTIQFHHLNMMIIMNRGHCTSHMISLAHACMGRIRTCPEPIESCEA